MAWLLRLAPFLGRFLPILGYWKLIAIGALAIGLFVSGYKVASWRFQATLLGAVQAGAERYREEAEHSAKLSKDLERERAKRKIVYRDVVREVEKVVDRPVYRAECIDDDGLRLINRALDGEGAGAGERN